MDTVPSSSSSILGNLPAGFAPYGVTPNFVDPPTLKPVVWAVNLIMIVIAAVIVSGRLIANWKSKHTWGVDDWCCLIAFAGSVAISALWLDLSPYARHQWDIPISWIDARVLKIIFATQEIGFPTILLAKVAILLLYRKIFAVKKAMKFLIRLGVALLICLYVPNFILTAVYCAPQVGQSWTLVNVIRCDELNLWYLIYSVFVLVLDIYIFILPLPTIFRLHVSRPRKVEIAVVFATASLAIVAAACSIASRVSLWHSLDQTWYWTITALAASVENYVALIVGSAPGFAGFMRTFVLKSTVVSSLRSLLHAMRMSSVRSLLKKRKATNDSSWGPPSGSSYSSGDIEALKQLPSRYHVTVGTLPGGTIHMMSSYQPE